MRVLTLLFTLTLLADDRNRPRGTAGEFDFYLLALSWSPQYCASAAGERDKLQCAGPRQYNFVVHGLWPQYESGWPQNCATSQTLSNTVIEKMLDIMPSRGLIRHEWSKHGVCSGLTAAEYFAKARASFGAVRIPKTMQDPRNARTVPPAKIREEFMGANAGMPKDSVTVQCGGRFLSEVRVCFDKNGKIRSCPASVQRQSCRMDQIIVQPIR
ncbi:MAG: ribonuclease T [Acidobacteria bacterium]|nr:ribonuclease T [Acidobacteriota bacterium]